MKTLDILKKLSHLKDAEVYLVGGFVRDNVRRRRNPDIDVLVKGISLRKVSSILHTYGRLKTIRMPAFDGSGGEKKILLFSPKGREGFPVQIAHTEESLLKEASTRDFTINAMFLPINFKSKEDIIDHTSGRVHIMHKLVDTIIEPEKAFRRSPIRMLRALSLASRTGYKISQNIINAIPKLVHLLEEVPVENIRAELDKILISKKPSTYFRLMNTLGILKTILPEIHRCVGVQQDTRYHKYDVFEHCVRACDAIEPDLVLRWAALLHDVGKPSTRKEIKKENRVTFHKHEIASRKLSEKLLTRLKYSIKVRRAITKLVKLHMYHYTREFSDAAVRKFILAAELDEEQLKDLDSFPLFKLRAAERQGNGLKTIPVTERQRDFQRRILEVHSKGKVLTTEGLEIDGSKVMKTFSIKPGKKIGIILNYLLEQVLSDPKLNTEKKLLQLTAQYLSNEIFSKIT